MSTRIKTIVPKELNVKEDPNFTYWDQMHHKGNLQLAASNMKVDKDGKIQAASLSLASIDAKILYSVKDDDESAKAFYQSSTSPEKLINLYTKRALGRYLLTKDFNILLEKGTDEMSADIKAKVQVLCDQSNLGVKIVEVEIVALNPPGQVAQSFRMILSEKETVRSKMQDALKFKAETENTALQTSMKKVMEAERDTNLKKALNEVSKKSFKRKLEAYKKNPELYKTLAVMNLIESITKEVKQVIVISKRPTVINFDLKKTGPDLLDLPDDK